MRHGKKRTRFGRQSTHRYATLVSLTRSLLLHQRIKTTRVKAKEARKFAEKIITAAKTDSLAARRNVFSVLRDDGLVRKLFTEIAPLFKSRNGGYTRIIPYNFRKGDGASVVILELTEKKVEEVKPKKSKKKADSVKESQKEAPSAKGEISPRSGGKADVKAEPKKEAQEVAPEVKPQVKEEKAVEDVKKEKARDEMRRKTQTKKGLMKGIKGFFRRKSNM